MTYVGICYESGAWGKDLTGHLIARFEDGWKITASHISSDAMWAENDIRRHFDKRDDATEGDTFEWAGRLTVPEIEARFGWDKAVAP